MIEDAAHCCGSQYFSKKRNKWVVSGEKTLAQCFSFYCNKCITTAGEGGMVVTNSEELADKVRMLYLHGLSSTAWSRFKKGGKTLYDIITPGYKYNLTDVAAAMGIEQLKRNNFLRIKRQQMVEYYQKKLQKIPL